MALIKKSVFLDCPQCNFSGYVEYTTKKPLFCSDKCRKRAKREKVADHLIGCRVRCCLYIPFDDKNINYLSYTEGIIESQHDFFSYLYNVRIDTVIINSVSSPHSWVIGTLGQINIEYPQYYKLLK